MKIIWITWERQRRNEGISSGIGAKLYELISDKKGINRYYDLSKETIKIIRNEKPDIVVAQNPSIVLATLIVIFKKTFRYKAIVDAHNSGIFPCESQSPILNVISKLLQKKACLTIVTNKNLCRHVEQNGGKGFVLPDRIPVISNVKQINLDGDRKIVFICSYSSDEPYLEVINAAIKLGNEYRIYFTGNYKGKIDADTLPANVVLLGFLPEDIYLATLNSADAIMDLTTRENCLVCGAYEGISLNKPMILSNTQINLEFFNIGCVYVNADSESIKNGILQCFSNYVDYQLGVIELKNNLESEWEHKKNLLVNEMLLLTRNEQISPL